MASSPAKIRSRELWIAGALTALSVIVYLALRPPIYDIDAYTDLTAIAGPNPIETTDPLHLLAIPMQLAVVSITGKHPYAPEAPFQAIGIGLCALALFFFCLLLFRIGASALLAAATTLFIATAPQFWYSALQNGRYSLLFAALVLFLWTWITPDGDPPRGWRLASSGLCLAIAILIHEGAVFIAPASAVALLLYGRQAFTRRFLHAFLWGLGTAAFVLAIYLWAWRVVTNGDPSFLLWTQQNMQDNGPLQFSFPYSFIQSAIGMSGAIVNDGSIHDWLEENLSSTSILTVYAALTVTVCVIAGFLVWVTRSLRSIFRSLKDNALAGLCLLVALAWAAIVIAWDPELPSRWTPILFPVLVLVALMIKDHRRWVVVFAVLAIPLSVLNFYLDHAADIEGSRNAPGRLVAEINGSLGKNDIFVVLSDEDWYGAVDYETLFHYLQVGSDQRGVAILNDLVLPANDSPQWRDALSQKIDSTLKQGGRVFVADHLLDPQTYDDMGNTKGAFAPKEEPLMARYASLDGPALFRQVQGVLGHYQLHPSDFQLADDEFSVIYPPKEPKTASEKN
jgi:hypothetical protein